MTAGHKPSADYLRRQYIDLGRDRNQIAEETGLKPAQIGSLLQKYGIRRRSVKRHGLYKHPLNTIWQGMKERCTNPNSDNYSWYGQRNISVCPEWLQFMPFYEWAVANGWRHGLTLDRIDQNGDYSPENCRFISHKEQCRNRRSNAPINIDGVTHLQCEWEEIAGLRPKIISKWKNRHDEDYAIRRVKEALQHHAN